VPRSHVAQKKSFASHAGYTDAPGKLNPARRANGVRDPASRSAKTLSSGMLALPNGAIVTLRMNARPSLSNASGAVVLATVLAGACSTGPAAPPPHSQIPASASAPETTSSSHAGSAPSAAPSVSAAAPSASALAAASPAEWEPPLHFERVSQAPVRWLSLGVSPYVAFLSDQPWMYDGKAWKELPLPAAMRASSSQREAIGIWFGRDDKPRIMGARWDATESNPSAHSHPVYLRYRAGGWKPDPKEIGRLGSGKDAGMYGILGNDDPEVVCKVGDVCIIKRRTGWKTLAATGELGRTWLCGSTAFVLDTTGMSRLGDSGFEKVAWEFDGKGKETAFWADTPQSWWVAVGSQDALYRYEAGTWSRVPSPVRSPAALWGSSPKDVWVVGADGAGHFDGSAWLRVKGLAMALEHVTGRAAAEVWVGGKDGLWRGN
jgi:hypothetical protein